MPTALVINPNTTQHMTDDIEKSAAKVFTPPWDFHTVQPPGGTGSIESLFESGLAATAIFALLKEYESVDGVVLACFGDPGLYMLREILPVPVTGIAEASFLTACMLGHKFGIVIGGHNDVPAMESFLWTLGLEKRYAGSWPMDMEVLEMSVDRDNTLQTLVEGGKEIIAKGGEVILLGCAGLGTFQADLQDQLGVPVIDPNEAGCRQLRLLVDMGLNTSHIGLFYGPNPKELDNLASIFEPGLAEWLKGKARGGFYRGEGN